MLFREFIIGFHTGEDEDGVEQTVAFVRRKDDENDPGFSVSVRKHVNDNPNRVLAQKHALTKLLAQEELRQEFPGKGERQMIWDAFFKSSRKRGKLLGY